jgi:HK97 gp10 family phage protein
MQMATKISVEFEGFEEFKELTTQITNDFGYKDASNMMVAAVRLSMRSALDAARSRVPVDTGALRASLQIEARKPRNKDRKSKYVQNGDVAIAIITTAPGKKLAKTAFKNERNTRSNIKQIGIKSDARATIMEFGSATTPAQPYLRPALESSSSAVVNDLSKSLGTALEKYKARQAKKRKIA